jgi:hypothetical protein
MANGTDVNTGLGVLGTADQAQIDQGAAPQQPPQIPPVAAGISAMTPQGVTPQTPQGVPQTSAAAPRPGSFGWKLSRVLGGVKEALNSLGDTGNIGKVPEGAGPLYGVSRTLAARNERLRQAQLDQQKKAIEDREQARLDQGQRDEQEKTKAYLAHEAIMTYKDQLVANTMDDEHRQKQAEMGKKLFDEYAQPAAGGAPSRVYAEGLSRSEAAARAKQVGKESGWDMTQQHIFNTGTEPVAWGRNTDGTPNIRMMPTYSIVGDSPTMQPSQETRQMLADILYPDIKDKQERLDKIPTTLKGREFGQLAARAQGAVTQQAVFSKVRADAGLGELSSNAKLELLKHTDQLHVLADALHKDKDTPPTYEDLQLAAQKMEHDNTWGGAQGKLRAAVFGTESDPLGFKGEQLHKDELLKALNTQRLLDQEAERERHDRREEDLKELQIKLGQNFTGIGAVLTEDMATQIANLPDDKQRVLGQITDNNLKATIMSLAFGPGDVNIEKMFPNRVYKGTQTLPIGDAWGIVMQLNKNMSEQQYGRMSDAYKKVTTGTMGDTIAQYNNVLEHMSAAQDIIENTWRGAAPQFLLKPLNAIERKTYGTQIAALDAALAPVRGEFTQFMAGNYKPTEEESHAFQDILNPAATPSQLETAFKTITQTGAIRLGNIDGQYKRIAGKGIPGLLTEDSMAAVRHINPDSDTMKKMNRFDVGDTLFHNPSWHSTIQDTMAAHAPANAAGSVRVNGVLRYYDKDKNIIDSDGTVIQKFDPTAAGLAAGKAALAK